LSRRAFSLLETLISVGILGGIMLLLCVIFEVGSHGFKVGTARLNLQSELRRIIQPLRRDLRNTSFPSVRTLARSAGPNQRGGVSCNGLTDTLSTGQYEAGSGLPLWNCYIVYFATLDEPVGKMVRGMLTDPSRDTVASPLAAFTEAELSISNPGWIEDTPRVLSDHVQHFSASLNGADQLITLQLRLQGAAGRTELGQSLAEVLEVELVVQAANTWPRL
jgi:hypothetical protein